MTSFCLHQLWAPSYQQQTPIINLYFIICSKFVLPCLALLYVFEAFLYFRSFWIEQILQWGKMWKIAKWAKTVQIYFVHFPSSSSAWKYIKYWIRCQIYNTLQIYFVHFPARQVLHENSKREVFVCPAKFHGIKRAIKKCISKRSNVCWVMTK